jgi:hypothetical protein
MYKRSDQVIFSPPVYYEENGKSCVSAKIRLPGKEFELFYKSSHGPLTPTLDPFLAAVLLPFMQARIPLQLEGHVSPKLLQATEKIQEIFHAWVSNLSQISITCESESQTPASGGHGVACFFSGGLDSFYTILKHRDEIDHLIHVRGYAMRLDYPNVHEKVSSFLGEAAAELGKPLIEVETNIQDLSRDVVDWTLQSGPALASVALLLSPSFKKVYMPATHTYGHLIPWGSSPLVDPLWSNEATQIVHDGCEATRVEKAKLIATSRTALKHLRVCTKWWDAFEKGLWNCNQCEKCLRTMVSLYLVGALDRCPTFRHTLDLEAIARSPIIQPWLTMDNLEAAEELGAYPALTKALRQSLNMARIRVVPSTEVQADLEQENLALRTTIQAIHRSRSWRVTWPFRALTDAIRRCFG